MPNSHTSAPRAGNYTSALLIDDDEISLNLTRITLDALGITQVVTALDGAAAMRLFDRMPTQPDLVVCDLYMPEMDGIELLNELGDRMYAGGIILMTAGDLSMMEIASKVATRGHGLKLLGAFAKPVQEADMAQVLGLPSPQHG